MNSRTGSLLSFDGLTLFTQRRLPETPAPAAVLIVHGYAEHSGRYAHVARRLTAHGYAAYAYDQRGHGRSQGPRAFVRRFDEYVADLHQVMRSIQRQLQGTPLFLLGHSMGGAVAALYCLEHGARPEGLILSSPALKVHSSVPDRLQPLGRPLSRLAPRLPADRIDPAHLSRDPDVVARVNADPLYYHGPVLLRFAAELVQAGERIRSQMDRLDLPLLLLQGADDKIVGPHAGYALYHRAASADKTLHRYDDFYHETLNEIDNERVLRDLTDWLDARI